MKNKFAIIIVIAATAFVSCGKDTPSSGSKGDGGTVDVSVKVSLPYAQVQGMTAQTRGAMGATRPDAYFSYFLLCTVPEVAANVDWYYDIDYDKILALRYVNWSGDTYMMLETSSFYLGGSTSGPYMNRIGFFPTKGDVSLYGFYPFRQDFDIKSGSDLNYIPFEVGVTQWGQYDNNQNVLPGYIYDYMYIVDGTDPAAPGYMEPIYLDMDTVNPGDTKTITAHFKHVMTCVEIRMKTMLTGTVHIDSMALDAFDGEVPAKVFARRGTFSAMNGSITSSESFSSHLTMRLSPTSVTSAPMATLLFKDDNQVGYSYPENKYYPFSFLFPAVEHKPGRKIKATIYLRRFVDGLTSDTEGDFEGQVAVLEFPFDNILSDPDGDGPLPASHNGLMQGFRYIYSAEVDNFIKYSGYPDIEDWRLPVDDPDHPNYGQIKDIVI